MMSTFVPRAAGLALLLAVSGAGQAQDFDWNGRGCMTCHGAPPAVQATTPSANPDCSGSTPVIGLGEAISIASILLFVELTPHVPLGWLLTGLAVGPALGLWALRPLWRAERSA